jgi:hypothetical protein
MKREVKNEKAGVAVAGAIFVLSAGAVVRAGDAVTIQTKKSPDGC